MTLFEALFYLFMLLGEHVPEDVIREGVKELMQDTEFLRCLQFSVDSSSAVQTRFEKVYQAYREMEKC